MNYYSHHIGDFDRDTRHLTRIERSVYSDLLDVYYDTEDQLSLDISVLARKIIARTNEELTAVQQVLNEFFVKTESGWYHERCALEIHKFKTSQGQKSDAGRASAAKKAALRQQAMNARSTTVATDLQQNSTNQEPVTNNQEPLTKEKRERSPSGSRLPADWVIPSEWQEWAEAERPDLQITSVVCQFHDFWIAKAGKEGRKADWAATWRNWVRNQRAPAQTGQQGSGETAYQRSMRERVAELAPGIARRSPSQLKPVPFAEEIFDVPVITSR